MKINSLSVNEAQHYFNTSEFHRVLEPYLYILTNLFDTTVVPVDHHLADVYEGNFYGLLSGMGIGPDLHWLTMRLNGLKDPMGNFSELKSLVIPGDRYIKNLSRLHQSAEKKSLGA